jgi:two-component system, OmpR family, response regulator
MLAIGYDHFAALTNLTELDRYATSVSQDEMRERTMYVEDKHILVVDSNERRRLTEEMLSDEGFAVTAVAEGFSAIRAASTSRFALAIVAARLPGMLDGATTVRRLRMQQASLKALFVDDAAARPSWYDPARDDFVLAPAGRRELLGCVFEMLERSPERAEVGGCTLRLL